MGVIYGASGVLGSGKAALHLEQGTGTEAVLAAASASGDRMGAALAAGLTLDTTPGATDRWVEAGDGSGMPGTPTAGQSAGSSLYGTQYDLYVGMPNGPGVYGSLYSTPWANVTGGTVQPVTTYAPGTGGLPAAGLRFGPLNDGSADPRTRDLCHRDLGGHRLPGVPAREPNPQVSAVPADQVTTHSAHRRTRGALCVVQPFSEFLRLTVRSDDGAVTTAPDPDRRG
ncbi:hypothetical protein [Streptomyces cyanogenus]|uniref:Uncharacterized protein n=1 Tax=Streptomyces cyanogenus TaxID=80860 RepID=A0ABX7TYF3_STRCY|nr:hypothetical protein [Streptomyces cyanogenus]QTE00899.1 hypothetical protein S1361_26445 [Streptomyces cyanogenus]